MSNAQYMTSAELQAADEMVIAADPHRRIPIAELTAALETLARVSATRAHARQLKAQATSPDQAQAHRLAEQHARRVEHDLIRRIHAVGAHGVIAELARRTGLHRVQIGRITLGRTSGNIRPDH